MNRMEPINALSELARVYHRAMPERIRRYLNDRGISDAIIDLHRLGWNGSRITIPIFNREGNLAIFKLAKDPEDSSPGPKMLTPAGASAELYGWERVRVKPCRIIVCEGEFDRLVLESHGIAAVTSTGGANVFRSEWAEALHSIPEVYVCFDRDEAGQNGALRVGRMIPQAKLVSLPEEVGPGGDITDFFVRLGHSLEDFERLLKEARPVPQTAEHPNTHSSPRTLREESPFAPRVERLKREVPIWRVVGRHVVLRRSGKAIRGLCPFHEDRVPSLVVYPEPGTFHCFGCGAHGDAITFLQKVEHLSFTEALNALERFNTQDETHSE